MGFSTQVGPEITVVREKEKLGICKHCVRTWHEATECFQSAIWSGGVTGPKVMGVDRIRQEKVARMDVDVEKAFELMQLEQLRWMKEARVEQTTPTVFWE